MRRRGLRSPDVALLASALVLVLGLAACTDEQDALRDEDGVITVAGAASVFDLRDGDCLAPEPDVVGEVATIPVVPCDQQHTQEVFASVELAPQTYPGAEAVAREADGACVGALEGAVGMTLADGLYVSYFLPTFVGWNGENPDRRVVCVLVFPGDDGMVGSVVAGTADLPPAPALPSAETGTGDA